MTKANARAFWSKGFVGHSGSAARLMYDGGNLRVVHDSREGIRNGENETGGELSVMTGIHEARRVGDELAFEHDLSHGSMEVVAIFVRFCFSDVINYAFDNIWPLFDRSTMLVFNGVAFGSYALGVESKR